MDKKDKIIQKIKSSVGSNNYEKWMATPNPSINDQKPCDLLKDEGGLDQLERLITAINFGIPE